MESEESDDENEDDDASMPSVGTLGIFNSDNEHSDDDVKEDNTDAATIRERARYLLEEASGVAPVGEQANPYKKRPAEISVEALDDAEFEDKEEISVAALADAEFQDREGDYSHFVAAPPLN
jgi:hypothetical protein